MISTIALAKFIVKVWWICSDFLSFFLLLSCNNFELFIYFMVCCKILLILIVSEILDFFKKKIKFLEIPYLLYFYYCKKSRTFALNCSFTSCLPYHNLYRGFQQTNRKSVNKKFKSKTNLKYKTHWEVCKK